MIALYIIGALLWAFVLFAILRRLTEQRRARKTWQERRAEREQQWYDEEAERMELWREVQHVMVLRKLEEWQ